MDEIPTPGGSPIPSPDISPTMTEGLAAKSDDEKAVPVQEAETYATPGKGSTKDEPVDEPGKHFPLKAALRGTIVLKMGIPYGCS